MSRTYRTEHKTVEPKKQVASRMRRCEMCETDNPQDEMYPIHDEHGTQIGLVCEICSADIDLIEDAIAYGAGSSEERYN